MDHATELRRLQRLAELLDSRFSLLGIRFGLDTLIGLVPGIGDAVTFAPSAYMIARAHRLGARKHVLARMALNSGIDFAIGTVPLVGDLFDLGFKANLKNVDLLRREMERMQVGP